MSRSTTNAEPPRTGQTPAQPGPGANTGGDTGGDTGGAMGVAMATTVSTDARGPGDLDPVSSTSPLVAERMCRIIAARAGVEAAHAELRAAVRAAREAGDSWATIGATLAPPASPSSASSRSSHDRRRDPP